MADITDHLQESIGAACAVFESLGELAEPIARAADTMVECLCAGKKLLVCGNGGSAADGADFSAEFGCRFVTDRRPYPALNLAQGGSLMSAIGNDYGYDEARECWWGSDSRGRMYRFEVEQVAAAEAAA